MTDPLPIGGLAQAVINEIPPHERFIEIARRPLIVWRIRPAATTVVVVPPALIDGGYRTAYPGVEIVDEPPSTYLAAGRWSRTDFIYCDPAAAIRPDDADRWEDLVLQLQNTAARVMVKLTKTGPYPVAAVCVELATWRRLDLYQCRGRQKPNWNTLFMNYDRPAELHDYRHLGHDYRSRERIRKRIVGWQRRLDELPMHELVAILAGLKRTAK